VPFNQKYSKNITYGTRNRRGVDEPRPYGPNKKIMLKKERLLLFILALVQFSHIIDFMIIMPLGKQFMAGFGINPQQFSLLVASYALSAGIAGLVSALYIDRFDRKKAMLWLYGGFTIATLACALAPNYELFLVARSMTGIFGGTLGALIFAIVGDVFPYERRGQAIGMIMLAFSVASIVGVPAGIFIAAEYGPQSPFMIIGLLSIVFIVVAWMVVPSIQGHLKQDENGETQHISPLDLIKMFLDNPNQQLALLFSMVLILGHFTIIPFIAPYYELNIGLTGAQIALMYAIGGSFTAICLPLFGRLADRYGHALIFTISSVGALFSIYAMTNVTDVTVSLALIITSSFFIVASGRSVPATTMVTSVVKPENRGSFMAMRQSVNQAGLAIASYVGGVLVIENADGTLGHYHYVGYFALAMSVLAVVLAWRLKAVG